MQTLKKSILLNPIWIVEHNLNYQIKTAIAAISFARDDKWLDVGCGLRPYESSFPQGVYIGVDIEVSGRNSELKAPDHYYDGRTLPFPDGSFEGVICTQVLEHVPDPGLLLAEMYRVLKPGGRLILSLPFVWQEHEVPYDFFRYTCFGTKSLLKQAGFEIGDLIKVTGTIETLAVLINSYIVHNLVPPIRGAGSLIVLTVCFPIQLVAQILQRMLPDNNRLYLNMVVRAKKENHASM